MDDGAIYEFFFAVHTNDLNSVGEILNDVNTNEVINALNEDGESALQVALEDDHYEIASLLLEKGIMVNTTLLRMIEMGDTTAVSLICKHKDALKEYGQNIFDTLYENDEYTSETTPLILAAEKNNYQIVKVLKAHGATMPSLESMKVKYHDLPTTQMTRIIYRYYKAISSEAYLLQTKGNLATDIFNICKQIKREQRAKKGMNDEFTELTKHLDMVTKKLFDFTRTDDEVCNLLAGEDHRELPMIQRCCRPNALPPTISDALLLNLKGFLSHDKCQSALADEWYQDFFIGIEQSIVRRSLVAALLTCLYPVFCIFYIVCPCGPIRRLMTVPFVKFVMHSASRLTFLGLLAYSTIDLIVAEQEDIGDFYAVSDEELRYLYLAFRGATLNIRDICVFIWIIGMTWREMNDIRRFSRKMYLAISFSLVDYLQLLFYWIFLIMSIVTMVVARQTVYSPGWIDRVRPPPPPISCIENPPSSYDYDINGPDEGDINSTDTSYDVPIPPMPLICGGVPGVPGTNPDILLTTFGNESRHELATFDPLLVAEAAFALANVLTFVRLLHTVVLISGRLGVLQISLIGMVGDICKFLILFFMIWISFSLGLTQLYRPFEEAKYNDCKRDSYSPCVEPAFLNLFKSMKTLFWALFGLNELEHLQLPDGLQFTEAIGHFLYALYLLVCVIVLLNALIAMMSTTYANIQENAEVEWKFCRSKMMTEYILDGAVLPPPFNLIPNMDICLACLGKKTTSYKMTNSAITRRFIHEVERQARAARQQLCPSCQLPHIGNNSR